MNKHTSGPWRIWQPMRPQTEVPEMRENGSGGAKTMSEPNPILTTYCGLIAHALSLGLKQIRGHAHYDNRQLVVTDSHYTASGVVVELRDDVDGQTYTVEIRS